MNLNHGILFEVYWENNRTNEMFVTMDSQVDEDNIHPMMMDIDNNRLLFDSLYNKVNNDV